MKKPILLLLLCLSVSIFSCSDETALLEEVLTDTEADEVDDIPEDTADDNPEDTPDDTSGNDNNTDLITLEADPDIIVNDGEGSQTWNEDVTLSALKINGSPGKVVYENRFTDDGFGVAGGRWQQIDYYYEYQGEIVKASEQLILDFNSPVNNVILQVGQMDPNEGRQAKEGTTCADNDTNRVDESGKWTAFNAMGAEIGTGILLDEYSIEGKLADSKGSYRFELDTDNISKIVIEATQWGGEERGCPTYRASYAGQALNDSGNTENNSEFNLMALSYKKQ